MRGRIIAVFGLLLASACGDEEGLSFKGWTPPEDLPAAPSRVLEDGAMRLRFVYDDNRLVRIEHFFKNDQVGTSTNVPPGEVMTFEYDDRGLLVERTTTHITKMVTERVEYLYDEYDRLSEAHIDRSIDESWSFSYGADRRVDRIETQRRFDKDSGVLSFTYDSRGDLMEIDDVGPGLNHRRNLYEFDGSHRLRAFEHLDSRDGAKELTPLVESRLTYGSDGRIARTDSGSFLSIDPEISNRVVQEFERTPERLTVRQPRVRVQIVTIEWDPTAKAVHWYAPWSIGPEDYEFFWNGEELMRNGVWLP